MELDFKTLKQGKRSELEIEDRGNGCFALNFWRDDELTNTTLISKELVEDILDFINSKEVA